MRQSFVRFWRMDILVHFRDIYIRVLSCTRSQFPFYHYWNRLEWLLAEASLFSEAYSEDWTTREEAFSSFRYFCVGPMALSSLVHVPPFFWNHRLSTLVIVLCAKTEFRLDQSNCKSPVRWWTWRQQRTALCSTHLDNHYACITHSKHFIHRSSLLHKQLGLLLTACACAKLLDNIPVMFPIKLNFTRIISWIT